MGSISRTFLRDGKIPKARDALVVVEFELCRLCNALSSEGQSRLDLDHRGEGERGSIAHRQIVSADFPYGQTTSM